VSTLKTICSAAGSITRRSLYHSCVKNVDRVVAQYGLIDERCGLETMARPLAAHASPGNAPQLLVHQER
jgi:hypothetical protein